MKSFILVIALVLSGCGVVSDPFNDNDELRGIPIKPLESSVSADLPTPAEASKLDPPPGLHMFSSVGFYSRGRMWGYWEVGNSDLWEVRASTISRGMNFANIMLWDTMNQAARAYYRLEPSSDLITIWDISRAFGGEVAGHVSHEVGLDVDIKMPLKDKTKPIVFSNIDLDKSWSLAVSFVETGTIGRIFTSSALKNYFCAMKNELPTKEPLRTKTLRALRPWPNHENHYHFRFKCFEGDKLCVDQTPVPGGSGCN